MNIKRWMEKQIAVVLVIAAIALVVAIGLFQPYMEARAYERVTGKSVSMWDAMWLDLRVQEGAQ